MNNRKIIIKKETKKFTEREIRDIYDKIVKKGDSYFKKYSILPPCPIKSWNFIWDNHDMPRNFTVLDFIEWTKKYEIFEVNELAITCENDPELEFINYKNKTLLQYPPYDLHNYYSNFEEKFNFFIFNQTIEHLYNPFIALKNIYRYLKKGGYVFTSVPTINIPHSTPIHYNGYNPMGLTMLFLSTGFEVLEVGQWGNYDYIQKLFKKHKWPDASNTERGCLHANEERNVCQCWILARKSA